MWRSRKLQRRNRKIVRNTNKRRRDGMIKGCQNPSQQMPTIQDIYDAQQLAELELEPNEAEFVELNYLISKKRSELALKKLQRLHRRKQETKNLKKKISSLRRKYGDL